MSLELTDLVAFGQKLRGAGIAVDPASVASFAKAVAITSPRDAYWSGRATLLSTAEQIPTYDRVFRAHFEIAPDHGPGGMVIEDHRPDSGIAVQLAGSELEAEPSDAAPASAVELLRHKRFDRCSAEELSQLAELMRKMALLTPARRTRRRQPARRGEIDIRRMARRSGRTAGEIPRLLHRERRLESTRGLLLLDISGSMAPFSRALLVFAHAAAIAEEGWETFCFGTRLTRVTRALRRRSVDEALRRAAAEIVDWDGGTRIGAALKQVLDEHGQSRVVRGAVALICSDGLDVGDPDQLGEQMSRLARLARSVVWVNPLRGTEGYEPLAGGMRAALPHVDHFADGHDLASLEDIALHLRLHA